MIKTYRQGFCLVCRSLDTTQEMLQAETWLNSFLQDPLISVTDSSLMTSLSGWRVAITCTVLFTKEDSIVDVLDNVPLVQLSTPDILISE